jgi:hypothetical protein
MHSQLAENLNFGSWIQIFSMSTARSWFSGKIIASHAMASGSIPEGRNFFG